MNRKAFQGVIRASTIYQGILGEFYQLVHVVLIGRQTLVQVVDPEEPEEKVLDYDSIS